MGPTWLFGISLDLIPKRELRLAFPRGPFAMLNIRDALGLAFFPSSVFFVHTSTADCRESLSGMLKVMNIAARCPNCVSNCSEKRPRLGIRIAKMRRTER